MNIILLQDIITCNELLLKNNLNFKIHLRDACGKQSCWIEDLVLNSGDGEDERLYQVLDEFFHKKGVELEYSDDKRDFWIK